jgi:hypothetical protein
MAVTALIGFEAQQDVTDQITINGTAAYSTARARTGAASLRCNPSSGASGYAATLSGDIYVHFGFYIASLPSVERSIFGNAAAVHLGLTSAGALSLYNAVGTLIGTTAATLSTATWYWIGIKIQAFTGDLVQVDGITVITGTQTGTTAANLGCHGTEASAIDVYYDDYMRDNAGFLAPSKVDLALPISDNTRTAVVTGDGAGTTNLWDAVNNTPPTGVVSASETATTNIEYPASATEDYIANLETYTTLGVASGDTVLAVRSIVQHGEDIATGTKNFQNLGALTNPTVAGVSVTAGTDAGAHGASPTLWTTTFGTLTASPSVTLGTSPTIRTSRISEARVACIDFMGMLVAWTPAAVVAANPPYVNPMPQLLAQ